jgi:hypothetical protein
MKSYINQYKLLFSLSWVCLYLIFPAWALPISVNARASVLFGLTIFIFISAGVMNRWFNGVSVDKPIIVLSKDIATHIKNNLWLVIVCCVAVVLHVYPLSFPILILGDEAMHLNAGLVIYDHIDGRWHKLFQIAFWALVALVILIIKVKNSYNFNLSKSIDFSGKKIKNLSGIIFIFLIILFFIAYFLLLRNIPFNQYVVRYPPLSKFLYLGIYSAFGIDYIFPRILQLIFYLLCAIYLYRTINLFYQKETALLGASLYLFFPVAFTYAHLGELASGTIFFIVAVSFYFIRFFKDGDNRDLLIATYLIGIGFLYKKPVLLIFIVCFIFLIAHKIRKHDFHSLIHLKILSLSIVTGIPWMIITKYFSWRNYTFHLSNFTSLDSKLVNYLFLMSSNLSGIIFILFVLSVFYICLLKRNTLTIFFGLLFIVYYLFIVSDMGWLDPRFSLPFYPTITVFLSLFISNIIQNIKWRHTFKLSFIFLLTYLIIICTVPPLNKRFLPLMSKKLYYYPSDKAIQWVKENVKEGESILNMRIMSFNFYRVKYGIDKNKIVDFWYEIDKVSTPDKLKAFYREHKISYIMFPYSPVYKDRIQTRAILEYLKNDPNEEFLEIAKFNRDENSIYIYKIKED